MRKVKIYSSPFCTYCLMAKNFLKRSGVDFEEVDVMEDEGAAAKVVELTHQTSLPVIVIDDKDIIIGYDESKLKAALGI